MKTLGVIPARLHSTRLPEKLIRKINDKCIIQYVWENVMKAGRIDDVIIAADNVKIAEAAESFGAKVVMTREDHKSGTDRVFEVAEKSNADVIVNIQGDEPLLDPSSLDTLLSAFDDASVLMATLCCKGTDKTTYNDPNVVKVVRDSNDDALYFSRSAIPYFRDTDIIEFYKHIGLYAYTRDFLMSVPVLKKSCLEDFEKLEQLRVLENGFKIKVLEVEHNSIGVDTEEDFKKVEQLITGKNKG